MPWPLDSGGHLRTYHLLRALREDFDVRLVTASHAATASVSAMGLKGIAVSVPAVRKRAALAELVRAGEAFLRCEPYVMFRRHHRREIARDLRESIATRRPSVLYFDHLDSLVYESIRGDLPLVIDLHNVYSVLAQRTAEEQGRLMRAYLTLQARLLERMERRAATVASLILAVSRNDAEHFEGLGARRVRIVPNGVDYQTYSGLPIEGRDGPPVVLFVGAMSWTPNIAAAVFLAREIFPAVKAQVPAATLQIIGRDPTRDVLELGQRPGVTVLGRVESMMPHLARAHALAVPLEAGGGTRLKILEAFAAGVPVLSTRIGLEGIAAEHDRDVVVAERPEFATALARLLQDRPTSERLALAARSLAERQYDWNSIGASLRREIAELLARRNAAAPA